MCHIEMKHEKLCCQIVFVCKTLKNLDLLSNLKSKLYSSTEAIITVVFAARIKEIPPISIFFNNVTFVSSWVSFFQKDISQQLLNRSVEYQIPSFVEHHLISWFI
jgi:hypothetical protein